MDFTSQYYQISPWFWENSNKKEGKAMTALEVWEKYKHLDLNLSDRELVPESFWGSIIFDMWSAIKHTLREGEVST